MLVITLPDNTKLEFKTPVTVMQVAKSIGTGLSRVAIAGLADDKLVDMSYVLDKDRRLKIITARDNEAIDIIRHSCAHLMAQSVKSLYPEAQVTIGPVIENGFYYDFYYPEGFTPDDLKKIEKNMHELIKADHKVSHSFISREQAISFFKEIGEKYKAEIIESIPGDEKLSVYSQGDFKDLCRGPHIPSTSHIKAFKLMKVAGAYWRGDSNNDMLQRIYGTAWTSKKELKEYLYGLEEAEKRDHRKLAKKLDLFHFQEEAPGMVFWHPKGWTIYKILEKYISNKMQEGGYQEIHTPQMADRSLWEKSGHWDKFRKDMFTTNSENRDYAIKPMNCPGHVQVFNQGLKSYRDLPLRLSEFGSCHRNEASGTLHGLMRTRNFTQDDAHIFCAEDEIQNEVSNFIDMLFDIYQDFGFSDIIIKLSTRPEKRVGSDETWDKSEQALELALDNKNLGWTLQKGEGAFYGPKVEFSLKDCIGRVWQCGTIQVDFSMPERLGATYISEDSSKQVPVMLHRAILGSMERFIGILIEHYAGSFPIWLSPVQVVVMSITEKQEQYARKVADFLKNKKIRAEVDLRNETIGLKIRDHTIQRVPFLVILGAREQDSDILSVRTREGEKIDAVSVDDFAQKIHESCKL